MWAAFKRQNDVKAITRERDVGGDRQEKIGRIARDGVPEKGRYSSTNEQDFVGRR